MAESESTQSAAAPSTFPPIADCALLSNHDTDPRAFSRLALIEAPGRIIVFERLEENDR
jgi:hypothetical protein